MVWFSHRYPALWGMIFLYIRYVLKHREGGGEGERREQFCLNYLALQTNKFSRIKKKQFCPGLRQWGDIFALTGNQAIKLHICSITKHT